jgi:hypothetical protein
MRKQTTTAAATPAGAPPSGVLAAAPFAAPSVIGIPAVLVNNGKSHGRYYVLIKSTKLAQQLQILLGAGIRRVEAILSVEGNALTVFASIVRRKASEPPYLYPLGEGGKVLAEIYRRKREESGRGKNSVPLLILTITPIYR